MDKIASFRENRSLYRVHTPHNLEKKYQRNIQQPTQNFQPSSVSYTQLDKCNLDGIWKFVFHSLDFRCLLALSRVCKNLYSKIKNKRIWQKKFQIATSVLNTETDGQLVRMVVYLTPGENILVEESHAENVEDFLTTYSSFASTSNLVYELALRFTRCPSSSNQICNLIQRLLRKQKLDTESLSILVFFIKGYIYDQEIQQMLLKSINVTQFTRRTKRIPSVRAITGQIPVDILDLDVKDFAIQHTSMYFHQFALIPPQEFLSYLKKDRIKLCPNLVKFINRFNDLSAWVASLILIADDLKIRVKRITKIIKIAKELRNLKNFYSLMAFLSGLQVQYVANLKKTWLQVKSKYIKILDELTNLMDPLKMFKTYRKELANIRPPCLPYLGFFFSDLSKLAELGDVQSEGINMKIVNKMSVIMKKIEECQKHPYDFQITQIYNIKNQKLLSESEMKFKFKQYEEKVKQLDFKENLPPPIILSSKNSPGTMKKKSNLVSRIKRTLSKEALYSSNRNLIDFSNVSFQLQEMLGKGGSASGIYRATAEGLTFAAKLFELDGSTGEMRRMIDNEFHIMQELRKDCHPNIVRYLGQNVTENCITLFMEFYMESLCQRIEKKRESGQTFISKEILNYATQIAQGVEHLHTKKPHPIIHRDLKSENVFVVTSTKDNNISLKIGDFGEAKIMTKSLTGTINKGTTEFRAPEVFGKSNNFNKKVEYGLKSDVWSYGQILYELLTLDIPYRLDSINPFQLPNHIEQGNRPTLPDHIQNDPSLLDIVNLFYKCTTKDINLRPNASQVVEDLQKLL